MRRFAETMTWAQDRGGFAIDAAVNERVGFIRKTYAWLTGEIAAIALLTWITLSVEPLRNLAVMLSGNLLLTLVALFGGAFLMHRLVAGRNSLARQVTGAGVWVALLTLLFVAPLCMMAQQMLGSMAVIREAFVLTACVFTGLTAVVFVTKKDFSFLRGALAIGVFALLGVAIIGWFFGGFLANPLWSLAWVVLLGGYVLYDTSRILHRRPVTESIAASVDLLTDFVLMFMHIAMLLMAGRD